MGYNTFNASEISELTGLNLLHYFLEAKSLWNWNVKGKNPD